MAPLIATINHRGSAGASPSRKRRGFTLPECLLASVVLAFAVIGVSSALSASYQQARVVGANSAAVALARERMEQIVAGSYSALAGIPTAAETLIVNGQTYTRTVSVEYRKAPGGSTVAGGDFALVSVQVNGPATATLRHLITAARLAQ